MRVAGLLGKRGGAARGILICAKCARPREELVSEIQQHALAMEGAYQELQTMSRTECPDEE
eukprot:11452511-Alexandrium_andersonii.AAC.1